MAIDYISTAPWNDPYRPFPIYNQIVLSAQDVGSYVIAVSAFDPLATPAGSNEFIKYGDGFNGEPGLTLITGTEDNRWIIIKDNAEFYSCSVSLNSRGLIAGWLQGNTDWINVDGSYRETISIVPVTSQLTAWEKRRRRLLEYI